MFDSLNQPTDAEKVLLRKLRVWIAALGAVCILAGIGIGVMPEVAAKRCARSMKINVIRIRDPWANRRLVICARSFKSLPKPAQQLAEHLRKYTPR